MDVTDVLRRAEAVQSRLAEFLELAGRLGPNNAPAALLRSELASDLAAVGHEVDWLRARQASLLDPAVIKDLRHIEENLTIVKGSLDDHLAELKLALGRIGKGPPVIVLGDPRPRASN